MQPLSQRVLAFCLRTLVSDLRVDNVQQRRNGGVPSWVAVTRCAQTLSVYCVQRGSFHFKSLHLFDSTIICVIAPSTPPPLPLMGASSALIPRISQSKRRGGPLTALVASVMDAIAVTGVRDPANGTASAGGFLNPMAIVVKFQIVFVI